MDHLLERLQATINSGDRFFIGRLSGNETKITGLWAKGCNIIGDIVYMMSNNAGIKLNTRADLDMYVSAYLKAIDSCTLLGVWDGGMHEQAIELYEHLNGKYDDKYIPAQSLEAFYYFDHPTYAPLFKDKTILVVSSHENTIRQQIPILDALFPKKIFENCKFIVIKPPQQHAGHSDGRSWTYHMEEFKANLRELSFDIALVSCGGFGMPICDFIYSDLKKSTMYIGGGLQLFFGIMGSRWSSNLFIRTLRNKKWCYPLEVDKPKGFMNVEGGCYW